MKSKPVCWTALNVDLGPQEYKEEKMYPDNGVKSEPVGVRFKNPPESGENVRAVWDTGAVRNVDGHKGRCDLLPAAALLRISHHMEDCLSRSNYPERNWEKGLPIHTMLDSAMRHILKYIDGMIDEDHLTAAATNLLMAIQTEIKLPFMQDIPARIQANNKLNE